MTREEQIEKAVSEVVEGRQTAVGRKKFGGWYFANWFKEGVKWADENPKSPWISVENDLPCNHDDLIYFDTTVRVLVKLNNESVELCYMLRNKYTYKWSWVTNEKVTHWMPIPKN